MITIIAMIARPIIQCVLLYISLNASTVHATDATDSLTPRAPQTLGDNFKQYLIRDSRALSVAQCVDASEDSAGLRLHERWPIFQSFLGVDSIPPLCMRDEDSCCNSFRNECLRRSESACYRDPNAKYVTITTAPMGWFLNFWPFEGEVTAYMDSITLAGKHSSLFADQSISFKQMLATDQHPFPADMKTNLSSKLPDADSAPTAAQHQQGASWGRWTHSDNDDGKTRIPSMFCETTTGGGVPCMTYEQAAFLMTDDTDSLQTCNVDCNLPTDGEDDGTCIGPRNMKGADGACLKGIKSSCLSNAYSVSMPVCKLIGDSGMSWGTPLCLHVDTMRTVFGLGSLFSEISKDSPVPTVDPAWIGIKLPPQISSVPSEDVFSVLIMSTADALGSQSKCNQPAVKASGSSSISISDLRTRPVSLHDQTLMLQIKHAEMKCGECDAEQGTDNFAYEFDYVTGISRCRTCIPAVEVRILKNDPSCTKHMYYKCEECAAHQHTGSITIENDMRVCQFCSNENPYRPNAASASDVSNLQGAWRSCGKCPRGQAFDRTLLQCEILPQFELSSSSGSVIVQSTKAGTVVEQCHDGGNDYTVNGFKNVPAGKFMLDFFKPPQDCDANCGNYEYASLCGKTFGGTEMYVRDVSDAGDGALLLSSSVAVADINSYEIFRQGKCLSCAVCSNLEYNSDCGAATNSAGTCTLCKTKASVMGQNNIDKYLYHEKEEGCGHEHARTDYELRQCSIAKQIESKFYLVVGCGIDATEFKRWTFSVNDEGFPQVRTCVYDSLVASDLSECGYLGRIHRKRIEQPKFWGDHYDLIPYCPPGWYIDTTALDGKCADVADMNLNPEYTSQCCRRCQEDIGGLMRGESYKKCDGSSTIDTQQFVAACENGRYRDDSVTPAKCKDCTRCAN